MREEFSYVLKLCKDCRLEAKKKGGGNDVKVLALRTPSSPAANNARESLSKNTTFMRKTAFQKTRRCWRSGSVTGWAD